MMPAEFALPSGTVIAIDGPAASGKGSLGRRLARHFGFAYLDTGLLYRATARSLLERGGDPADEMAAAAVARELDLDDIDAEALRSDEVIQAALGPIASEFIELKTLEWETYDRQVSAWEVDQYLTAN